MTDTVLLTGITGFLGGHLARELLASGYHVRGSLRNPARAEATAAALAAMGADTSQLDFVTLDLTRDTGWTEAAAGARFVLHSASPFVTTMPRDPQELIRPAVVGTERALAAARTAGVERVVMTSSTVAIVNGRGSRGPARLGPEDWADPAGGRMNAYATSKTLAERRAWQIAAEGGPELAVINPGFITGPLPDNDPGTSGALILRFLRGQIPVAPKLFLHNVDVRDLARIHVAALTAPEAAGRRHPAAFSEVSIRQVATILANALPDFARKMPRLTAPDWLIRAYALFDGDMRANVHELSYAPHLDASRAAALLGHSPIPPAASIADMARDMIAKGLV